MPIKRKNNKRIFRERLTALIDAFVKDNLRNVNERKLKRAVKDAGKLVAKVAAKYIKEEVILADLDTMEKSLDANAPNKQARKNIIKNTPNTTSITNQSLVTSQKPLRPSRAKNPVKKDNPVISTAEQKKRVRPSRAKTVVKQTNNKLEPNRKEQQLKK